jgi:putative aminopeptidase FrvX
VIIFWIGRDRTAPAAANRATLAGYSLQILHLQEIFRAACGGQNGFDILRQRSACNANAKKLKMRYIPMIKHQLLHEVCSLPTAPFAEGHVVRFAEQFVARHKGLSLRRDRAGNLLIELASKNSRRSRSRQPRWVFTAHMDHPGFIAREMLDARTLAADFRGWVKVEYVRGTRVRFFAGRREITGVVTEATVEDYDQRAVPHEVKIRVTEAVPAGSPGMFDQGEGRVKGKKFFSRACDDLAGLAAALEMLRILHRNPPEVPVAVLLTRAEEEGFIGCIAACERPELLKKTDRVIAIETSSVQPAAPQGDGAIIRIGDRSSIFNSSLTYFLSYQAEQLAKKDPTFKSQRALMPGGTCEATVYDIYGFTAASLCVALGNYHNMDVAKKKIGPEYIDVADWENMVKLFVQLARTGHEYQPGHKLLKERILKRYEKLKHLLA